MISFFPTLYEDELLYSAIARYHIRSGNISPKATIYELFNSKTISAVVELPSNIDNLIKNMPVNCKYTQNEFINNNTMFPLYTAFLPAERKELIYELMRGKNGGDIYNRVGLMATSIRSNKYLKFCPECIKEDKLKYGELYWHRIHQIPGIAICSKHKIPLLDSKVLRKTFHPLRHLLLMQFLDLTLDKVFNDNIEYKPFGEAPWPCLNGGAEHYLQPVIDNLKITYDGKSKKTIGTFTCSCGFVYSRSGPDMNKEDRYKVGRIKIFGPVWEKKLRNLVQQKLSLRQIARELKVDPVTVDRYAEKLGLEIYWRKSNDKTIYCPQIKSIDSSNDKWVRRTN